MLNGTPNEFTTFNGVPVPVKDQFLWYRVLGIGPDLPALCGSLGVGDGHAVQVGEAGARRTSAGRLRAWPCPGPATSTTWAASAASSITSSTSSRPSSKRPASRQPDTINGIKQRPIEGVSMAYTWDKANANAPTRHTTQYFEMLGNRAIYHDGWVACDDAGDAPVGAEHRAAAGRDHRVQVGAL